jgi:Fur family transcriptional regulator, zinc uptake regulator
MIYYNIETAMPHDHSAFVPHDHAACTHDVLALAERRLADAGQRMTPVRRRALEILLGSPRALGAYEVLERLVADGFANQPPVAYRALEFLEEQGLVHRIRRLNAYAACMHVGEVHAPAFLICRACHAVAEAPAGAVVAALEEAAQKMHFTVERSTIEALGLCPACKPIASGVVA